MNNEADASVLPPSKLQTPFLPLLPHLFCPILPITCPPLAIERNAARTPILIKVDSSSSALSRKPGGLREGRMRRGGRLLVLMTAATGLRGMIKPPPPSSRPPPSSLSINMSLELTCCAVRQRLACGRREGDEGGDEAGRQRRGPRRGRHGGCLLPRRLQLLVTGMTLSVCVSGGVETVVVWYCNT